MHAHKVKMETLWTPAPSRPAAQARQSGGTTRTAVDAEAPLARAPRKRALLVGINYYGTPAQLSGCVNDVNAMRELYRVRLHVTDFTVLTDVPGSTSRPTKARILDGLEWLVAGCQRGDVLLLHYSGHGTTVRDTDGNEASGRDSTIVPCDYTSAGVITDDHLRRALCDMLPCGVTFFGVFDSCYSGSVLDLRYSYLDDSRGPAPRRERGASRRSLPDFSQWRGSTAAQENLSEPETAASIVMLSGCTDTQTSADAYIGGSYQGAMSWALQQSLGAVHLHGLTLAELLTRTRALLQTNGYAQVPQLDSGQLLDVNVPLGRLLAAPI